MKYVVVTGGVMSGLGKGITAASIGRILINRGYHVTSVKIDPYLNIDAGLMNPAQHGEVFVLKDGGESDLDLGNYERFLDIELTSDHNLTTGKIYQSVITKERHGDYLGATVQIIPPITDEIKEILSGKLAPERKENFIGYADVIALFTVGKGIRVAGCRMSEGTIKKDAFVRLLRNNVVIYDGKIGELRREKNEVKEVSGGVEFGMSFDKYNDLKEGDRVECYEVEEVRAQI